jgi:hypothetical protein
MLTQMHPKTQRTRARSRGIFAAYGNPTLDLSASRWLYTSAGLFLVAALLFALFIGQASRARVDLTYRNNLAAEKNQARGSLNMLKCRRRPTGCIFPSLSIRPSGWCPREGAVNLRWGK